MCFSPLTPVFPAVPDYFNPLVTIILESTLMIMVLKYRIFIEVDDL
jgi:hypothetical protein